MTTTTIHLSVSQTCRFGCGAQILTNGRKQNDNNGYCRSSKYGDHHYQPIELQMEWIRNKKFHRTPVKYMDKHGRSTNRRFQTQSNFVPQQKYPITANRGRYNANHNVSRRGNPDRYGYRRSYNYNRNASRQTSANYNTRNYNRIHGQTYSSPYRSRIGDSTQFRGRNNDATFRQKAITNHNGNWYNHKYEGGGNNNDDAVSTVSTDVTEYKPHLFDIKEDIKNAEPYDSNPPPNEDQHEDQLQKAIKENTANIINIRSVLNEKCEKGQWTEEGLSKKNNNNIWTINCNLAYSRIRIGRFRFRSRAES